MELLGKLMDANQRHVRGKENQLHLVRQLAFENAGRLPNILAPYYRKEQVYGINLSVEILVPLKSGTNPCY